MRSGPCRNAKRLNIRQNIQEQFLDLKAIDFDFDNHI
jgi:hypothetical protein